MVVLESEQLLVDEDLELEDLVVVDLDDDDEDLVAVSDSVSSAANTPVAKIVNEVIRLLNFIL